MTIDLEIKGQLAKLLATEDLVVEHKKVETAMFNVDTRVLTLPMWKKASNEVYDMLVSHEVGHALFTPNEDPTIKVPMSFINIVEDARIEKMMKRKYAGIPKTFRRGYLQLHEDDFFCLKNEDISSMNLADRVNLLFKVGSFMEVPIKNSRESDIVDMVSDAETFFDVQIAAEALYKYCKEEQEANTKTDIPDQKSTPQNSGQGDYQTEDTEQSEEQSEEQNQEQQQTDTSPNMEGGSFGSVPPDEEGSYGGTDPEVKTDSAFNNGIKNLVDLDSVGNNYVEFPDLNLDSVINSNNEVHSFISNHFKVFDSEQFDNVDKSFKDYKKTAQKEVNYLVKEFECRKAADSYSRASTARTGVLDCTKLHTYKYNEDLFKKVTVIPDGKNHGLVFILDWSGSMSNILMDTLKQLYNLIWFCKKTSIPFRVYAFTYEFNTVDYDEHGKATYPKRHYDKKDGLLFVDERFSLMEFFTSKVTSKELETQMKNIWRIAYQFRKYARYSIHPKLSLSGTPLNESVIALNKIIPLVKKQENLQKVHCVILTDGESAQIPFHKEFHRKWDQPGESYIGTARLTLNSYLRSRKTGKVYQVRGDWKKITETLLTCVKDENPTVNFIGIRIVKRDVSYFIRQSTGYDTDEFDKAIKQWNKDKCVSLSSNGYTKKFGLSAQFISQEVDFEVKEDATKTQIKSAFIKSLKTKKLNKKILGEFVEVIC
jgi:hypothetical protein